MADDIEKNTFKDQPKEFQHRIMEALKRIALGELPQRQIDAANSHRKELEKFALIGKAAKLFCGRSEEYVDWGSRGSPADSLPAKQAKTADFSVKEHHQQGLSS